MSPREALVRALRRVAPGTIARLDDVDRLRQELDRLHAATAEQQSHAAATARDVARLVEQVEGLHRRLDEVTGDLHESRRLSLRVAQLTDLVFDRLVAVDPAPGDDVTTAPTDL